MNEVLNTISTVVYSSVLMYVLVYWVLWFFKVPYYRKMKLHTTEAVQIFTVFYLFVGGIGLVMQTVIAYNDNVVPPPFTFWFSLLVLALVMFWYVPKLIVKLRNKIPNRWE